MHQLNTELTATCISKVAATYGDMQSHAAKVLAATAALQEGALDRQAVKEAAQARDRRPAGRNVGLVRVCMCVACVRVCVCVLRAAAAAAPAAARSCV